MTVYLEDLQIVELAIVHVKEHLTGFYVKDAKVEVREHLSRYGDFNGNGVVDDNDIDMILEAYGSRPGDPNWREEFDLNKDGVIDMRDVGIVSDNYGMRQGDVEPVDTILTDEDGLANFGELPPGKYHVTVSKEGYKTVSATVEFPGTLDINVWPIKVIGGAAVIIGVTCIAVLAGTKAAHWW